jgi:hypothetical protein
MASRPFKMTWVLPQPMEILGSLIDRFYEEKVQTNRHESPLLIFR